jgi:hypothetical protein
VLEPQQAGIAGDPAGSGSVRARRRWTRRSSARDGTPETARAVASDRFRHCRAAESPNEIQADEEQQPFEDGRHEPHGHAGDQHQLRDESLAIAADAGQVFRGLLGEGDSHKDVAEAVEEAP